MIRADLASIPERRESLERTVASLLPQVDRVGVYLNGWDETPPFLPQPTIDLARSQDHGDRGDAGKFFWAGTAAVQLCCDDDLEYPPDYVARLLAGLDRHPGAACSFHGYLLRPPFRDPRSRIAFRCLGRVDEDEHVHVVGTGALGFRHGTIRIGPADFEQPNMADVWFARAAQQQSVPLVVLAHEAGWLRHTQHERTIWDEGAKRTGSPMDTRARQQQVVGAMTWRLP